MFSSKQIIELVTGKDNQFGMAHKIFNCAIAISISSLIPAFIFTLFQHSWSLIFGLFITNLMYFYIYYLCRFSNQLQKAVFVYAITGVSLLNAMWIIDRGIDGSSSYFIFIAILIITFTAEKPLPYLIALMINFLVLNAVDDYLQTLTTIRMPVNNLGKFFTLLTAIMYACVLTMLYKGLNHKKMNTTYQTVMNELSTQSSIVNHTADNLAQIGENLLSFTLQQKTATEQLSVTTEQLGATAQQNSQLANTAMSSIKQTELNIFQSKDNIDILAKSMEKIQRSSEEIQNINNVINDIAYQTNILSLNAMIEASRAENSSGGFKVVALEVKRLSERSAKAANSINQLLNDNFDYVQEGVNLSQSMKKHYNDIASAIEPLTTIIQNVNDASLEQNEAIRQITVGIEDIDLASDQNKNLVTEASKRAIELRSNAKNLMGIIHTLNDTLKHG